MTRYFRLSNKTTVPATWLVQNKIVMASDDADDSQEKFDMNPKDGTLYPNKKKTVAITFCPTAEKIYNFKFTIKVPPERKVVISVKGTGISINLSLSTLNL